MWTLTLYFVTNVLFFSQLKGHSIVIYVWVKLGSAC